MAIRKIPVAWQTGAGGSGVSVFYSAFGVDPTVELGTFFNSIKASFPTSVTWDIPQSGDTIDEATGQITGAWTAGTPNSIAGTGAVAYAAGTGIFVRWQTAGIVNGRRVRGRTFLCPTIVNVYEANGTIVAATLTTTITAANLLVGAGKLVIWHRPSAHGMADGSMHTIIGSSVPDKVTSLRTRRS
jgi:hypothetical protein